MTKKTILVLDPDPDLGELVALILQSAGFAVRTATSISEVARLPSNFNPDLIVTEALDQDDLSQFDARFLARLRRMVGNTPILLCSIYNSTYTLSATDLGLAGLMHKPFDIDDLVCQIKRLLDLPSISLGA